MTTYYVNPLATAGNNDGTSYANAWTSLAYAPLGMNGTAPVAGDVVLCHGGNSPDETISSPILFNGNNGDSSAGRVRYTGCNHASVIDGTRYRVDGGGISTYCFQPTSDWLSLENFEVRNASSHGCYIPTYTACDMLLVNQCWFHDNGGDGFSSVGSNSTRYALFTRNMFTDNTGNGWHGDGMVFAGYASGNGASGFYQLSSHPTTTFVDCASLDNGAYGFWLRGYGQDFYMMHNCVADNNTTGGMNFTGGLLGVVSGCRVTQNGFGVDGTSGVDLLDCYMPGAGQDRANTTNLPATSVVTEITVDGANSNVLNGTDTDGGYVGGSPNYDYQTTTSATLHNETQHLGWATSVPRTAGLSTLAGGAAATEYNPFTNPRF